MLLSACIAFVLAGTGAADDKRFRLAVPEELAQTGFLKYLLPRFSLKHGIGIETVGDGDAAVARLVGAPPGRPVFQAPEKLWHLRLSDPAPDSALRFADWLGSEIGRRTIAAFERDGVQSFRPPEAAPVAPENRAFDGDPAHGARIAERHCARCHVVRADERLKSIGSTPSFFALRTIADWDLRFASFYDRNPHPSFTAIEGVTGPFSDQHPPPIVPLVMSLDDLQALLAYVAQLPPADLGAPIRHQ